MSCSYLLEIIEKRLKLCSFWYDNINVNKKVQKNNKKIKFFVKNYKVLSDMSDIYNTREQKPLVIITGGMEVTHYTFSRRKKLW